MASPQILIDENPFVGSQELPNSPHPTATTTAGGCEGAATNKSRVPTANSPFEQDTREDGTARLDGFPLYAVALGVCFGSLMVSLDISIIGTALPSIVSEFGSLNQLAWYPAAYTFAGCALTPLAGKMGSVFRLNWVYITFAAIFLVGNIVCGCAATSNVLYDFMHSKRSPIICPCPRIIAGRAIAGIGSAGVSCNGMSILVIISSFRKKTLLVGLAVATFGIGLVLGPVLGGVFTERLTWRWCFWINLPFIAVSVVVIFILFKPPGSQDGSFASRILSLDLLGCAIFVGSVFMLLLSLQRGGQDNPWNSVTIIGLLVGSVVCMMLFVAWEWHRGNDAMIPGRVVARRTIVFTLLFVFLLLGSLTVSTYYLPEWFQVVQGVSPLQSGIRMLPTVITQIIATSIAGRLTLKLKYYNFWFFLSPVFMCTSSILYTRFTAFSTPMSHWIGFQVIQGVGVGLGMQMSSLSIQLELRDTPTLVPIGIALVTFMQFLGGTVVQVIAGAIFNNTLVHELESHADLTERQIKLLAAGGITHIRDNIRQSIPGKLDLVLEAYNGAITTAFFIPVAGTATAFFLAFGIKWNKIPDTEKTKTHVLDSRNQGENKTSMP